MRAASHVPKLYLVKVAGKPDASGLEKLRRGLTIPAERNAYAARREHQATEVRRGKDAPASAFRESRSQPRIKTAPAKVRILREAENPWYEVTLTEGKNRQIRKMFAEIGHHVEKIKRVKYGPLVLDVHPGEYRHLSLAEVQKLRAATGTPVSF
jgi:23S rRNA pseudouridine2605 synthase